MNWLCLSAILLTVLSSSVAKRSFVLTGPKLYDRGENETLVLNFFDTKDSGNVKIRLLNSTGDEVFSELSVDVENGESKTVQLFVPSKVPENLSSGRLDIKGSIGDYKIDQTVNVGFRTQKPIVFVNTDKPLYKAGQTVRIRVLVTDSDLRPHKEAKVGEVWITDPNRIRVAQWLNISFSDGLVHRELALPEEPVLGSWTIHVKIDNNDKRRLFQVKEYVLPPYEVTITPPPYMLPNADNATWEICAKYSYGKPVRGKLVTKLSLTRYYWQKDFKYIENETEINGCKRMTLPVGELFTWDGYYSHRGVDLSAEVTEEGTGTKMNSTSTVNPVSYPYTISRVDNNLHYFRPRIPLKIVVALKTPDSKPLPNELVKVCMEAVRRKWNDVHTVTDSVNVCKNYTSNEAGYVIFTIPPQDSNTVYINIDVEPAEFDTENKDKRLYRPRLSFKLAPWFSPTGNHIQLEKFQKVDCSAFGPDVRVTQRFHITYNEPGNKRIYYQVIARGEIVRSGDFEITIHPDDNFNSTDDTYLPSHPTAMCTREGIEWDNDIKSAKFVHQNIFVLKLSDEMIPRIRVLLYTVTDDGEIVADSTWYDVDPCFDNQVEMKFGEEKQYPGSKATIHLKAEPKSLCSIGVVDTSVYFLDKGDLLTGQQVSNQLFPLDTSSHTSPSQATPNHEYCAKKKPGSNRNSRNSYEAAGYLDTISAVAASGGVMMTDLPLETRPCKPTSTGGCYNPPVYYSDYPQPVALGYAGGEGLGAPGSIAETDNARVGISGVSNAAPQSAPAVTVRTNFPDTWLFDLHRINDDGTLEIEEDMPDSITEWKGEALCIHPDKGLGLSKPSSIVGFQPFFASLTLPYSVIRNETMPVIVTVFNYLKDCLSINVHLDQTDDFVLYNGTLTKDLCVCGEQSVTKVLHVKPVKLGEVNITVTASTSKNQEVCGDSQIATDVKRSDTLTKPVLVEAEGFLKEETKNTFFCLEDIEGGSLMKTEHLLKVPDDTVKDSARAYCYLTGDLMGPTLEGLDRLVRMPTGCGEQNMIALVPNIVVLDYLNATGRLTKAITEKALENIQHGYMREQQYRHSDGSYSAFGPNDKEGSMWLTAFVVKSFTNAERYISIDNSALNMSKSWILSRQRDNGCFPVVGTLHNNAMKGGISKENETTPSLTAYIVIAMSESGEMNNTAVTNALKCIEAKNNPSNYSSALFAYAASLVKDDSVSRHLQRLLDNAETDDGFIHWKHPDKSIEVETAGYAILALLKRKEEGDFQNAASIVRWLTQQRNPYGGFYSTQDTIVALQALGEYGALVTRSPLNMGISIKTDKIDEMLSLNKDNELLTQRINLKLEDDPETSVDVEARGSGCALVQTHLKYNLPTPEPSKYFELTVQTQKSEGNCRKAEIRICASYNPLGGSNMAIVEIKMVSGYRPVKNTLEELLHMSELEIQRYEYKEDTVNLYVSRLTQKSKCFSFDVKQDIQILDAKPTRVKVFDYYDSEKSLSVPYAIEETCA